MRLDPVITDRFDQLVFLFKQEIYPIEEGIFLVENVGEERVYHPEESFSWNGFGDGNRRRVMRPLST